VPWILKRIAAFLKGSIELTLDMLSTADSQMWISDFIATKIHANSNKQDVSLSRPTELTDDSTILPFHQHCGATGILCLT
jgi:hypothetical protein